MYLAALQLTIRRHESVIVSHENSVGVLSPHLNKVQRLFNLQIEGAVGILERRKAFDVVYGGQSFIVPS